MPFIRADDLTVHYEIAGPAGAPVIMFANSLGTNFHVWDRQVEALQDRFRVLRYDMRGHGLSDCPAAMASECSIERLAGDARALLDALEIERVYFCGLSIGGLVGQQLAATSPERVAALVLLDTANRIGPASAWEQRIAAVRAGGMAAVVDGVLARWFTPRFLTERRDEAQGYANMLTRTPADGYVGCCVAIRDANLREADAQIRCPTLVIVGDQDAATPPSAARELASAIAGARIATIADAAHIPTAEQPEELNHLLSEFFVAAACEVGEVGVYDRGMAVRRAVLGVAHVEQAGQRATEFDRDFQAYITRQAWGEIWTRPGLSRKTRSMLTIAMLAALGHEQELKLHIRATANTGVSRAEVKEILLQTAVYAGVPAANSAYQHARGVYEEMDGKAAS